MRQRSLKVRPDSSSCVFKKDPEGSHYRGRRAGRAGTSVPNGIPEAPSPPGAWPSCPSGHKGPNRVHSGRPSRRDSYPGARCVGCRARPAGPSGRMPGGAANLSALCPSNHLQAQVTAKTREKCGRTPPRQPPKIRKTDVSRATAGWQRRPPVPETPRPSTRCSAQVGSSGGTSVRLRETERALRPTRRLRRVSPRPLPSLPTSPRLSPGDEPDRRGGRGRGAGPPPCWAGT